MPFLALVPAGPAKPLEELVDTIESVLHHTREALTVVVLDGTDERDLDTRLAGLRGVVVIDAPHVTGRARPLHGPMLVKQLRAIDGAGVDFDVLLKLDSDALIIADGLLEQSREFFARHPDVGLLGAYTRRGDGTTGEKLEAMRLAGHRIKREAAFARRKRRMRPTRRALRKLMRLASRTRGYSLGDTCTGGAYLVSGPAARAIRDLPVDLGLLADVDVAEDQLMGLIVAGAGFTLSDFPVDDDPLAINWRGMPMSPEELVAAGKKLVHSVKDDGPWTESGVREFFRARRCPGPDARGGSAAGHPPPQQSEQLRQVLPPDGEDQPTQDHERSDG